MTDGPFVFDGTNLMKRKMAWDIIPCEDAKAFMSALGLPPASDEVEDEEHRASHLRLQRLNALAPILGVVVPMATEVAYRGILEYQQSGQDGFAPEEFQSHLIMTQAGVLAVLSHLLDMGILHLPGE